MKIDDSKLLNTTPFNSIPFGGLFKYRGEVWLRVVPLRKISMEDVKANRDGIVNAVNIKNGESTSIDMDTVIEYLENSVLYLDH